MKKTHFEKLIHRAGHDVWLSDAERAKMRFVLSEYMAFKPRAADTSYVSGRITLFFTYLRRPALASVAATLILALTGSSVAFASEGSLPGDVLYPIKVAVVEPARTLFTSTKEKAKRHMALAERRLDEASLLAKEGRLDETTEETLAIRFSRNANLAAEAAEEDRDENRENADFSSDQFAERLGAYENVLAQVKGDSDTSSTKVLRAAIRGRIENVHSLALEKKKAEPAVMALRFEATDTSSVEKKPTSSAGRLKTETDKALRMSADLIGSNEKGLDASSRREARRELKEAEAFAAEGRKFLGQNDPVRAEEAFTRSLKTTSRLEVFTRSSAKLKVNVFGTTTETNSTHGSERDDDADTNGERDHESPTLINRLPIEVQISDED